MTARVALLVVGDELLAGRRRDHNGVWMVDRCAGLGARVHEMRLLPDAVDVLGEGILQAAAACDVVVLSGGLGPTTDDVTRDGVARAAGVALKEDVQAWAWVERVLSLRGRQAGAGERRQALLPIGAGALANPVGVAPGLVCAVGASIVLALPGVPRELEAMFDLHVVPLLEGLGLVPPQQGVLWVAGVPEGEVAARLEGSGAIAACASSCYPHDGEVELRFEATGARAAQAVAAAVADARARLGADVFDPPPGGRLEHATVAALAARRWRVATAESVTGGLIARMLTRVPGASAVYPVGWVPYATPEKTARLGVPADLIAREGVVSGPVAVAMAEGARREAATEAALATTGTAGPAALEEAGRPPVPPGRVFVACALAGRETVVRALELPHPRELVQRFAAVAALDLLRRALAAG